MEHDENIRREAVTFSTLMRLFTRRFTVLAIIVDPRLRTEADPALNPALKRGAIGSARAKGRRRRGKGCVGAELRRASYHADTGIRPGVSHGWGSNL